MLITIPRSQLICWLAPSTDAHVSCATIWLHAEDVHVTKLNNEMLRCRSTNDAEMGQVYLPRASIVRSIGIAHRKSIRSVSLWAWIKFCKFDEFSVLIFVLIGFVVFLGDSCTTLRSFIESCSPIRASRLNFSYDSVDVDENGNYVPQDNWNDRKSPHSQC